MNQAEIKKDLFLTDVETIQEFRNLYLTASEIAVKFRFEVTEKVKDLYPYNWPGNATEMAIFHLKYNDDNVSGECSFPIPRTVNHPETWEPHVSKFYLSFVNLFKPNLKSI